MRYTATRQYDKHLRSAVLIVACSLFAGCQATYTDYTSFIHEPRPLVTATTYRMAPPDVILITSKRVREINNHREMIRPDGMISPPLLGPIFVAGRTPEEVSAELKKLAQEYYEDADVSLRVSEYRSKKIYVFGEVGIAGPFPYNGANTVLGMLARSQPTRLADPQKIHILRPNAEGELIRRMTIDMNKMVKEGDTTLNAVLEEGDIIYVPPNGLAAIGLVMQQILLPLAPVAQTIKNPVEISSDLSAQPYTPATSNN